MLIYNLLFLLLVCVYVFGEESGLINPLLLVVATTLALFAGIRAVDVSQDGANYTYMFDHANSYTDYFKSTNELMATVIPVTLKYLGIYNYLSIFLVFAILGVAFKIMAIKKYSAIPLLSCLFYYIHIFLLHEMTQIRVGVATGILLFAVTDIYHKRLVKFLIKVAIATTFHTSAVIFIVAYFFSATTIKKWWYLCGLIIIIPLGLTKLFNPLRLIPGLTALNSKLALYDLLLSSTQAINLININMLWNLLLLAMVLYFDSELIKVNKYSLIFIKLFYCGFIATFLFAAIPVLSWRISEIFTCSGFIVVSYIPFVVKPKYVSLPLLICSALGLLSLDLFRQGLVLPYHTLLG